MSVFKKLHCWFSSSQSSFLFFSDFFLVLLLHSFINFYSFHFKISLCKVYFDSASNILLKTVYRILMKKESYLLKNYELTEKQYIFTERRKKYLLSTWVSNSRWRTPADAWEAQGIVTLRVLMILFGEIQPSLPVSRNSAFSTFLDPCPPQYCLIIFCVSPASLTEKIFAQLSSCSLYYQLKNQTRWMCSFKLPVCRRTSCSDEHCLPQWRSTAFENHPKQDLVKFTPR